MLKPSDLNLTGEIRTIASHKARVIAKLKTLANKNVAAVCLQLLDSKSGTKLDISMLIPSEINEIKNYFAECAGPVWISENNLIPGIKDNNKIFFAVSDTERLYDCLIYKGKGTIAVSNKQAKGGTNTLKPGDVVDLVDKDKGLKIKWGETIYYNVFNTLKIKNTISGPITAIRDFYPALAGISINDLTLIINQMVKNDVVIKNTPKSVLGLIKQDAAAARFYDGSNNTVTGTMVNFLFEKILIKESERDEKYNELFMDITDKNVTFLKFNLDKRGIATYAIADPKTAIKKAKLRSKQGVERRASSGSLKLDKLGFQP